MNTTKRTSVHGLLACGLSLSLLDVAHATELVGFAELPANTFAPGPTSGQFAGAGAGGNTLPLVDKQPVQGVSAVLPGPSRRSFYVMSDNGFGAQTNSADALLRIYAVQPQFRVFERRRVVGEGTVLPVHFKSGAPRASFDHGTFITLSDPRSHLGFATVSEGQYYPNGDGSTPVDPEIIAHSWLTGADLDVEAVRRDHRGHLWFGDEFGPFLLETDKRGKVVDAEIPLPNLLPRGSTSTGEFVQSPQNPHLGSAAPNLGRSSGFEGLAINPAGTKLFTLLEGTVTGDDSVNGTVGKNLRIDEFDIDARAYTGKNWLYVLEPDGTNIGDMTAINDHEFLVIERNGATATSGTPFKRIYVADLARVPNGGVVRKRLLVDLMNIDDPHDLNQDGDTVFTFPYVTIESVLILDPRTLLVINDNNYPGTGGRDTSSDDTEFLKLRLEEPLNVSGCGH